jgi:hypothetical protein
VGRSYHRGRLLPLCALQRARILPRTKSLARTISRRIAWADRKSLLLGTALTSTLILAVLVPRSPARALSCPQPPGGPIALSSTTEPITCVNAFNIYNAPDTAISLRTNGTGLFIALNNSGNLSAVNAGGDAFGIYTDTLNSDSPISIVNTGTITVTAPNNAFGIRAANVKARDGESRCGAYIIDTRQGDILHWIRFDGAVRELFDASFIPGVRAPMCVGLGNPEMRTVITFDGEASGSTAQAVA